MNIEHTQYQRSLHDLFGDTIAYDVFKGNHGTLEELVPNFLSGEPLKYATISGPEMDSYAAQIDDATAFIFNALDRFMISPDADDQMIKMGIHNPRLRKAIRLSWELEEHLPSSMASLLRGTYGNFDFTLTNSGHVAIYEFNGNTPVLTYESIALQDQFHRHMTDKGQQVDQFNELSEAWQELFDEHMDVGGRPKTFAFSGFSELVNDLLTVETMSYAAYKSGHLTTICDIRHDIEFDHLTKRFHLRDGQAPIDVLFNMFPWEELDDEALDACNECYENFIRRGEGTILNEPAYKVLMSNKGFLAWMFRDTPDYAVQNGFIPTFMSKEEARAHCKAHGITKFVGKPVYGRMSSNIIVYDAETGEEIEASDGAYADDVFIYQPFQPMVEIGQDHYQLRMWVAPRVDHHGDFPYTSCGFAVRKSNSANNMDVETEEFIPHVIT